MPEFIQENISLLNYCWLKVGGAAEFLVAPENIEQLKDAVKWAKSKQLKITILGDGSNVLISDQGIRGLVVIDKSLNKIESTIENNESQRFELVAQSGVAKSKLMRSFLKAKLAPALFLSGLPGNLGGGIIMNAGVREDRTPKEFCEIVDWFEIFEFSSLSLKKYKKEEINWSYRKSTGYEPGFITKAQISWPMDADQDIPQKVLAANQLRLSKQPLDLPSCGSVFKNPEGTSAGKLIEECGLKGYKLGGAQISEKHANFIVNIENAKAQDVFDLIQKAMYEVKKQKAIELHPEVRMLGEW
jgi:UDP-N-acetylmuramate dehydrogenase